MRAATTTAVARGRSVQEKTHHTAKSPAPSWPMNSDAVQTAAIAQISETHRG